MDIDKIVVGNSYKCKSPLLTQDFVAKVEKVYALSALMKIDSYDVNDSEKVEDLNGRLVIPFQLIYPEENTKEVG